MSLGPTTRMLAPFLDSFTQEELDALPFGIVQLDAHGHVVSINRNAMDIAGWTSGPAVGRDYFADVCPQAHVAEIVDRYTAGFANLGLDEMFRVTFVSSDMPLSAMVRMYYSTRTGTMWLFSANPDGSPYRQAA